MSTAAKRIGKYPVIREIGTGAMGKVFEGFDRETGAKVAIKVLRAEHLADEEADSSGARFEREAQVGLQLRHPNIVRVYGYGEQGRIRYIAMEFIHGHELRLLMRQRGRFELGRAVSVLLQLLDALECSHRHGIVHRDIKPSNIMVIEPLLIKVMDFGIARIASAAFTQVGTLLGTPTYMSPEQMSGVPVDGRADLWAAGVILYELLTGRVPFSAPTALGQMRETLNNAHTPVRQLLPELPAALEGVLSRALAKRREDRWQTATEFAHALRQAAAEASTAPKASTEVRAARGIDLDLAAEPGDGVDLVLDGYADGDATVVQPPAAASAAPGPPPRAPFHPAILAQAEARLALHLGPTAGLWVGRAAAAATTVDDLYEMLGRLIGSDSARRTFLGREG